MTDRRLRASVASCVDAGLQFRFVDGSPIAKADLEGVGAAIGMRSMQPEEGEGIVLALQTTPLEALGSIGACIDSHSELATSIELTKHGRCGCFAMQWNIPDLSADGVEYAVAAYETAAAVIRSCRTHGARWHPQWDSSVISPGFFELDEAVQLAKQDKWPEADEKFRLAASAFACAELNRWYQRSRPQELPLELLQNSHLSAG